MAKPRRKQFDLDSVPPPKASPIPLPKGWKRASDALDRIESVSTIFPDFNRATRCGGLPINRIHTIHGPTHGGKTAFVIGLMKSFLDGGHIAAYVDAEHSTPQEFATELIGDLERHPNFLGSRPTTYEETIDGVNEFLKTMEEQRKKNPKLCSICVIDSINKLTPARELKNILKDGGDELSKGHAGRYRAAVNQAWLNHLSPRLKPAGCAMVMIAQERDSGDGEVWDPDGGVEIKGGQALSFDATLLIRVSKAYPIRDNATATDKKKGDVTGFVHRVRIYKSKVSHMDGAFSDCVFHFSNGRKVSAGFDLQRDALYVAKNLGIVQVAGSWLSWNKRRWQGEAKAAQWFGENRPALMGLVAEIDQRLATDRRPA
jgi:RecA/RadA recombinase